MSLYQSEKVHLNGHTFRIFLTREEIEQRVKQLGDELSHKFRDKKPIIIGVLNVAYIFLAHLLRHMSIPCEVDFLKMSSYADEKVTRVEVKERREIEEEVK